MASGFSHKNCRRQSERRSYDSSIESLESRQFLSAISITSDPINSELASGTPEIFSRTSSVSTMPDTTNSFNVAGTNAALSVQGVAFTTTASLKYSCTTTQIPASGSVTFSANNSSTAKDTVFTFSRAGNYGVKVSIHSGATLVSVTLMNMNVVQTSATDWLATFNL